MKPKYYLYMEQDTGEAGRAGTVNDMYEFDSREGLNQYLKTIGKFNSITYLKIISGFTLEERKK